jgi:serine/threonine-protein kinase
VRVPNADVPPELEAICVKATARDREHRYATARELAEAVERYLEGDRDLALRARMSREHGERARQLATRKTTLDRSEALGAVGRALALDPSNRAALATMVELLTSPPPDVPPEAAAAMRTRERVLDRTRSRAGLVVIAFWMVASLVTTAIVGVGQVSYLVLATSTVGIALVLSIVRLRQPRKDGFMPTYYVAGIGLAIAGLGIGFSPEYITPTIAVVFVISCTLAMDPTRRLLPMFIGCVAISLPFVLEWLGALDPSFVERDAMLCALARMTRMPDTALVGPLLMNIVCIVMGCLYAVRLRDALTEMQRRDSIHAWQLRQLVPARM